MAPLRTGIALAITTGVFYALCALVWNLAPGLFLSFMNNLFHGMDFTSMVSRDCSRGRGSWRRCSC